MYNGQQIGGNRLILCPCSEVFTCGKGILGTRGHGRCRKIGIKADEAVTLLRNEAKRYLFPVTDGSEDSSPSHAVVDEVLTVGIVKADVGDLNDMSRKRLKLRVKLIATLGYGIFKGCVFTYGYAVLRPFDELVTLVGNRGKSDLLTCICVGLIGEVFGSVGTNLKVTVILVHRVDVHRLITRIRGLMGCYVAGCVCKYVITNVKLRRYKEGRKRRGFKGDLTVSGNRVQNINASVI